MDGHSHFPQGRRLADAKAETSGVARSADAKATASDAAKSTLRRDFEVTARDKDRADGELGSKP